MSSMHIMQTLQNKALKDNSVMQNIILSCKTSQLLWLLSAAHALMLAPHAASDEGQRKCLPVTLGLQTPSLGLSSEFA